MQRIKQSGTGNIRLTLSPGSGLELQEIRLTLNAAGGTSENFTATIQSDLGDAYNVILHSQDMNAVAQDIYLPARPHYIFNRDELLFEYTNTNSRLWGLEIIYNLR